MYGRLTGDMAYRFDVGVLGDFGTETARPALVGELAAYQTLGIYGVFAQRVAPADQLERTLSLGMSITPLFLLRWSRARETGHAFWDLTVDSLGITAGLALTEPRSGGFASEPGFEFGGTVGFPLLNHARGLWLRVRANLVTGRPPTPDQAPIETTLLVSLGWQGFFQAGILKVD